MPRSLLGLALLAAVQSTYVLTLLVRRTLPTRLFDAGILLGLALTLTLHFTSSPPPPWWPLAAATALAVVHFAATRKELALPRTALRIAAGDPLPDLPILSAAGPTTTLAAILPSAPALIVLYRGWWCPYCVTQLGQLGRDHDDLRAAGLSIFALSVDRPDEQTALAARLGGKVTFLSDPPGALLDALGVRHPDGVPWYDRLLFGARRQDIALPATLLVDRRGVVRFARRSRTIDERPPVAELIAAWKRAPMAY